MISAKAIYAMVLASIVPISCASDKAGIAPYWLSIDRRRFFGKLPNRVCRERMISVEFQEIQEHKKEGNFPQFMASKSCHAFLMN
ncbi:hypothetical protein [Noviherbaspirillum pedocola]|uniref:hypothetical protein n=1 Tax=Noviherbaspirillum pedocola TaxID=2801341 RepID=UPI00190E429E|nr:hypothetical protein [Noviherbaspirillum pedocola]